MDTNPHILIAYKKTRYEHYISGGEQTHIEQLIAGGSESAKKLKEGHETHRRNLERIIEIIQQRGYDYTEMYRGDVQNDHDYDLIVSVGGDGTVLELSHRIDQTPILAINSAPERSIGYFCAGDPSVLSNYLTRIFEDELAPFELSRLDLLLNGERRQPPALNDLLICHQNPAAVSEYTLRIGDEPAEKHRSSGLWISTAAGSTAAIRSAGGDVMPLESTDFQYRVREPFPSDKYENLSGIHSIETPFEITSEMNEGHLYLDGPHIVFSFSFADTLQIRKNQYPLRIFGLDKERRKVSIHGRD